MSCKLLDLLNQSVFTKIPRRGYLLQIKHFSQSFPHIRCILFTLRCSIVQSVPDNSLALLAAVTALHYQYELSMYFFATLGAPPPPPFPPKPCRQPQPQ